MSEDEIVLFEEVTERKNVSFVPHGIRCDFYRLPLSYETKKDGSILMVGNWLRNFELANEVFVNCLKRTRIKL